MSVGEVRSMPVKELREWSVFLSMKDTQEVTVEKQLMKVFGGPGG